MAILKSVTKGLWISGTEEYYNKCLEILNKYVTYRKKYLIQNDEDYLTVFATISDWNLKQHIKGNKTCGIFVNNISKFLTFDIDLKVKGIEWEQYNKWILYKVVDVLQEEGLGQYMNISFSGNKGYHIDLIFNNPIKTEVLKRYGEYIIKKYQLNDIRVNNKLIGEVELRGCNAQGVKIPLGINQKTKKYMYYLGDDLKPITQKKLLEFNLKILNADKFYNLYSSAFDEMLEFNTKDIINKKPPGETGSSDKTELNYNKSELDYVVQNEILKNQGSRNNIIYLVALWCNSHKLSKDQATEKLYRIIENTPQELYQDRTSIDWKYKECNRVLEKVYANNLVLFDVKQVGLNTDILEFIMQSCKTIKQMNIFLCHIYHAFKWGNDEGIYFLSENRICSYAGVKKRDTVINLNKELIDLGILEVVERGRYVDLGNGIKKGIATTYKLTIPKEILKDFKFYIKNDKINFIKVSAKYLDKNTILKYIPKSSYYDNFKTKKSKVKSK